jgi:hypothetical protein
MQPATANKTGPRGCQAAGSYAPKRPAGQADTLCFAQGAEAITPKNAAWIRPCGPKPRQLVEDRTFREAWSRGDRMPYAQLDRRVKFQHAQCQALIV